LDSAYRDQLAASERFAREQTRLWREAAKPYGVPVDFVVESKGRGTLSSDVIQRADRLNAMIALASQSGAGTALLMGSGAREIIRGTTQPVWVVHPGT
jgi:nucleotide-binding universal stress UspA family protein